jgi:hypothetical protein
MRRSCRKGLLSILRPTRTWIFRATDLYETCRKPSLHRSGSCWARKLLEIANSVEPVQGGRIHIGKINWPFLSEHRSSPAEYGGGLKFAIERGWLRMHESALM